MMTNPVELSQRKKILFSLIVLFIVCLFMEILAQVAFRSIYSFSYKPTKLVRLTSSSWMVNQDDVGMPAHFSQLVIHPYMGFAVNHTDRTDGQFGFMREIPSSVVDTNDQQLRVLVVGGSVALQLSDSATGKSALEKALDKRAEKLGLSKKRLFFSAAMPGFKQPQQLLSYTYLASLGVKFDVVINVDGFNEMTLAMLEGQQKGLHPTYPRGWDSLVGNQMTAGKLRSIGKLLRVRDQQASTLERAQLFPRSALFGLYFANQVVDNERNSVQLVAEIEHNRNENSLSFEAGGPAFDLGDKRAAYQYLANLWLHSSQQLALSVEANRGQYIQVFQPNQYLEKSKPLSELEKQKFYVPNDGFGKIFNEALPSFNTAIMKMEKSPWFVDSSMIFAEESATVYSDVCCHFNQLGLELLADYIVAQVAESKLELSSKK